MSQPHEPGSLGPPPSFVRLGPSPSGEDVLRRMKVALAIVAAVIAIFIALTIVKGIYLNLLWFRSVGYGSVYTTRITTRVWLFFAGGGVATAFLSLNLIIARRLAPTADAPGFKVSREFEGFFQSIQGASGRHVRGATVVALLAIAALSFAVSASGHWQEVLLLLHSQSFGKEDPQFHRDLGFYVFQLPVYRYLTDCLLTLSIMALVASCSVYAVRALLYGFRIDAPRPVMRHLFSIEAPGRIRLHVSLLLVLVFALVAVRYLLARYALVYSTQGVDVGAFYTDLHATLPMLYVRVGIACLSGALLVGGLFPKTLRLAMAALCLWSVGWTVTGVYPLVIQRFVVQPNELDREVTYLSRNIDSTRWAFGLDQIDERPFPAIQAATEQQVRENQATIDNVRLWDPDPLRAALTQIQTIRPLFEFRDIDVDRYTIGNVYRQVMLGVRDLNQAALPADAKTWVNRRLQFTHGYGYTVASVNSAQPDGSPSLIVQDIPLQGPIQTARPEVYFGEEPDQFIVVGGTEPEFTPLAGGVNVQTRYEGPGGIGIASRWRRFLYSWQFRDLNLLISGAITPESRIIYRRNVQQRIHEIAPFLRLDADPYVVVDQDFMYWIQDAYTVSDQIPYSHRDQGFNYIRNSVKVVVNAYSGEVGFYVTQPDEPILKAYAAIFPSLFKPLSAMPQSLKAHLRYPEDLFAVQTREYLRYHITDARQLYRREDQWDIPTEIFGGVEQQLRPYYVLARLPGETQEEFILILPFVPRNRTNAIGWIAARSDGPNYGHLVSYRFPITESVPGPTQVERRIDSDGRVSQQLTLWNQSGSKVIRGDILMIPIAGASMFFEPLYLAATTGGNEIPQLKRIVVVNGETVVMEPTLSRALDVLFGHAAPSGLDTGGGPGAPATTSPTPSSTTPSPQATTGPGTITPPPSALPSDVPALVALAEESYDRAQLRLKAGDLGAFADELSRLKVILDRLREVAGTPVAGR